MRAALGTIARAISLALVATALLDGVTFWLCPPFFLYWPGRFGADVAGFLVVRDALAALVAGVGLGAIGAWCGRGLERKQIVRPMPLAILVALGGAVLVGVLARELSRSGTLRLEDLLPAFAPEVPITDQTGFMAAHGGHLGAIAGWIAGSAIVARLLRRVPREP